MKIACLQFAPQLGKVEENIQRAESILNDANLEQVDLLILPELAFTGYNFPSLAAIEPYLEPTTSGPSSEWAIETAARLSCIVAVGYPERTSSPTPQNYNSLVTVSPKGDILANYRKTHLYCTDETWASEGGTGFFHGNLGGRVGNVVMGICMDINPYRFVAPWGDFEFARHVLTERVPTVVLSMSWLAHPTGTPMPPEWDEAEAKDPHTTTLAYWIARLEPIVQETRRDDKKVIVVLANRCGREEGACYAGTSTVLGIRRGGVESWDVLGRDVEECLVVDTSKPTKYSLRSRTPAREQNTPSHEQKTPGREQITS